MFLTNKREDQLGARQKLNSMNLGAAALIAGFLGLMTQSIVIFVICFGVVAAAMIHDGSVRMKPTR
jgi:hypothetical protein